MPIGFSHTRALNTVDAIYLTVQNLPWSERFKQENIVLWNYSRYIWARAFNKYSSGTFGQRAREGLEPRISFVTHKKSRQIKLAISCVSCNMPASWKVQKVQCIWFLRHNASLGCIKCLKFPTVCLVVTDFSGQEHDNKQCRVDRANKNQICIKKWTKKLQV